MDVRLSSKGLGVELVYSRQWHTAVAKERVAEMERRLQRLETVPLPRHEKQTRIRGQGGAPPPPYPPSHARLAPPYYPAVPPPPSAIALGRASSIK